MPSPRLISLFSGAGGLDYGFEAAGFSTGACVEFDADSCRTLRASRPDWAVFEQNIFDVRTSAMLEAAGASAGEIDLVIGGPPCQPFSKAGYWARGDSARLSDPRAQTLDAYLRVIREAQPRAFLLENVRGLNFKNKGEGLEFLRAGIDAINASTGTKYTLSVQLLDAADYGVPQHRERLFVIGSRDGRVFDFPAATHGAVAAEATPSKSKASLALFANARLSGLEPFHTAYDALRDAPVDDVHDLAMRGRFADLLPSIPEGHNYLWHTEKGQERAAPGLTPGSPLFGWRRHYWTFLLKLAKNLPSWTIQAQPGPASGPFHWDNRRLSPREMCRLQTFPDDVRVQGKLGAAQRQIGNAVPSLLGEVLGREIRKQLLDAPMEGSLKLLPKRALRIPAPRKNERVPEAFQHLEGAHEAHPGTGRGRGAIARAAE
jgi:DNA (cytosine-5)-methyltransferase 1